MRPQGVVRAAIILMSAALIWVAMGVAPAAGVYVERGGIDGTVTGGGVYLLSGIDVQLYDGHGSVDGSTVTDASGKYSFVALPIAFGPYRLRFVDTRSPEDWAPKVWRDGAYFPMLGDPIDLRVDATATIDVALTNSCMIWGDVHRLGGYQQSLSGITAQATWMSEVPGEAATTTSTSGSGMYFLRGLARGSWHLSWYDPTGTYGPGIGSPSDLVLDGRYVPPIEAFMPLIPVTASNLDGVWHKPPWSVALAVAAGDLPPFTTRYSVDGGVAKAYTGPITVSGDGTVAVTWSSADSAGNREVTRTANVLLDSSPPTSTSNADGGPHQLFSVTSTDTQSGVKRCFYRLDGSAASTYTMPIMIHAGTHAVSYWAVDNVGNIEATKTGSIVNGRTGAIRGVVRAPNGSTVDSIGVNISVPNGTGWGPPQGWASAGPTGIDGSFEIKGVVPGSYLISVWDRRARYLPYYYDHAFFYQNATPIAVSADATTTFETTLTPAGSVHARVMRTGTAMPIVGAAVNLDLTEGTARASWSRTTGADGSVTFANIPPGQFVAYASAPWLGYALGYFPGLSGTWAQAAGESKDLTLWLDPVKAVWIALDVHRLGGGHEPMAGMDVVAEETSGTGIVATRTVDAAGSASFDKMAAGTWRVSIADPLGRFETVHLPGPLASSASELASGTNWASRVQMALLPVTTTSLNSEWHTGASVQGTFMVTPGDRLVAGTYSWIGGVRSVGDIVVAEEGVTDVGYGSVDVSGSVETTHHVLVRLDRSAPMTKPTMTGGPQASLTLLATDMYSGVTVTRVRVDGAAEATYTAPIVTTARGIHRIEYWSVDVAGNSEARGLATVVNTPACRLGSLSAPASVRKNKKFTVSGTISPKQKKGNKTTKILAYRLAGTVWVYNKSFSTTSNPSGSKSKFSGSVKLGSKGKWRLIAHSPGYSGYWQADSPARYVIVK